MKKKKNIIYLFALLALMSQHLFSQTHERVTVIGTFEPSLGEFTRLTVGPERVEADFEPEAVTYTFIDKVINTQIELESIPPLQIIPESRSRHYHNYLKAAIGSRLSPYFIYRHYSPISRNTRFGLGIRHFSTWSNMAEYAPSDFMNNRLNLNFDHNFRSHALFMELYYQYNTNRHYGFIPEDHPTYVFDKADILQRYINFGGTVGLQSKPTRSNTLYHNIIVKYNNISDYYGSSEHAASAMIELQKDLDLLNVDSKQAFSLDSDLAFFRNTDSLNTSNASKIGLAPAFIIDGDFFFLKAGISVNLELGDSSRFHLYPAVHSKLFLLESSVEIYANFTGGLQRKSLQMMASENPFISTIIPYQWENTPFRFKGGTKAAFIPNLELHFGVTYANIANKAFYVTDKMNPIQNTFSLVFDDVQFFNFTAEVAYRFSNKLGIHLGYNHYEYTMTDELHPWHEPLSKFSGKVELKPTEKLGFNTEVLLFGTRYAPYYTIADELVVVEVKELDPALDVNIGAVYYFSERFSTFATINNLLSNKYHKYLNYPVYGIQLYAGLTYSF